MGEICSFFSIGNTVIWSLQHLWILPLVALKWYRWILRSWWPVPRRGHADSLFRQSLKCQQNSHQCRVMCPCWRVLPVGGVVPTGRSVLVLGFMDNISARISSCAYSGCELGVLGCSTTFGAIGSYVPSFSPSCFDRCSHLDFGCFGSLLYLWWNLYYLRAFHVDGLNHFKKNKKYYTMEPEVYIVGSLLFCWVSVKFVLVVFWLLPCWMACLWS